MTVKACTGNDLEEEIFGVNCHCNNSNHFIPSKLSLEESFEEALKNQPRGWRPQHPKTAISKKFFEVVAQNLGRDRNNLYLYISIGMSLDFFYGIDCFFLFYKNGKRNIVTVDVTCKKFKPHKADFLLTKKAIQNGQFKIISLKIAKKLLGGKLEVYKIPRRPRLHKGYRNSKLIRRQKAS